MAAVREVVGLRLLRPLLAVPKSRLIATLASAGQPWLIDPANAAQRFARGRLRADPGFSPDVPWAQSEAHAVARHGEDEWLAAWLARLARPHRLGFVRIDAAGFGASWSRCPGRPLLGRLLATIGGRAYPVAAAKLGRVAEPDVRLRPPPSAAASSCAARDDLLICREPGRIRHRLPWRRGRVGQWDGRFAVRHEHGAGAGRSSGTRRARRADAGRGRSQRACAADGVPAMVCAWAAGRMGRSEPRRLPAASSLWVVSRRQDFRSQRRCDRHCP